MKESLKFKGSKLIVQEAADPSTILWENLRVSLFFCRFLSHSVSAFVSTGEWIDLNEEFLPLQ
jgi:hypothetical protein